MEFKKQDLSGVFGKPTSNTPHEAANVSEPAKPLKLQWKNKTALTHLSPILQFIACKKSYLIMSFLLLFPVDCSGKKLIIMTVDICAHNSFGGSDKKMHILPDRISHCCVNQCASSAQPKENKVGSYCQREAAVLLLAKAQRVELMREALVSYCKLLIAGTDMTTESKHDVVVAQ